MQLQSALRHVYELVACKVMRKQSWKGLNIVPIMTRCTNEIQGEHVIELFAIKIAIAQAELPHISSTKFS